MRIAGEAVQQVADPGGGPAGDRPHQVLPYAGVGMVGERGQSGERAPATPVVGRLGDMFGKRRMLLLGIVLLVSGSVVCALADSLVPMIIGRGLQGLAAAVIPLGISIMRDVLPAERLAGSTALMSASLGVGGALGLPAAAFIADNWDWHLLFWTSAALGALAGVILAQMTTDFGGYALPSENGFKVVMAIGAGAALLAFVLASFIPARHAAVPALATGAGPAGEGPAGEDPAGERAEVTGAAKA